MQTRFVEPDLMDCPMFAEMMDEILVVCPRCEGCARIAPIGSHRVSQFAPRRLICEKCGSVKNWSNNSLSYFWWQAPPVEPYFQLPLWLSLSCCSKSLWFLNPHHMELVEGYVRAELREKLKHPEKGWFNNSLYNRLPKFIKEAKHREEILKAIEKLKHKV